jgi:hypothetical protein
MKTGILAVALVALSAAPLHAQAGSQRQNIATEARARAQVARQDAQAPHVHGKPAAVEQDAVLAALDRLEKLLATGVPVEKAVAQVRAEHGRQRARIGPAGQTGAGRAGPAPAPRRQQPPRPPRGPGGRTGG